MKKIINLLLIFCITLSFSACSKEEDEIAKQLIDSLKEFKPSDKTNAKDNDDKNFNLLLDKLLQEELESDYLTMHYSVEDYKAFNIKNQLLHFLN